MFFKFANWKIKLNSQYQFGHLVHQTEFKSLSLKNLAHQTSMYTCM